MPRKLPPKNLLLGVSVLMISLFLAEVGFRLKGYDFEKKAATERQVPIYYRLATRPVPPVFFHRNGPDHWHGKVIYTELKRRGGDYQAYDDESEITASYDRDGFRNPDSLSDWEIAVAGDSFTELGYLAHADLFTSILSASLGRSVKNLGQSYTGTFGELAVLKNWGLSGNTRHWVIVFYEGNDLRENEEELADVRKSEKANWRPMRVPSPQSSFFKALTTLFQPKPSDPFLKANAAFQASVGEIPITIQSAPPRRNELSPAQREATLSAFLDFGELARSKSITPWMVFMPGKHRVTHEQLKYHAATPPEIANWNSSDLPDIISELANSAGLRFVDVTPALQERSRQGILTYNAVWDTHLNREGSHIVGRVLCESFKHEANLYSQNLE